MRGVCYACSLFSVSPTPADPSGGSWRHPTTQCRTLRMEATATAALRSPYSLLNVTTLHRALGPSLLALAVLRLRSFRWFCSDVGCRQLPRRRHTLRLYTVIEHALVRYAGCCLCNVRLLTAGVRAPSGEGDEGLPRVYSGYLDPRSDLLSNVDGCLERKALRDVDGTCHRVCAGVRPGGQTVMVWCVYQVSDCPGYPRTRKLRACRALSSP